MRIIGLTGGIASGKSTVSAMLRDLGARVLDADAYARQAVQPGSAALCEIVAAFGPEVLLPDGTLDRRKLGAIVFADPAARQRLNGIVHPRVRELMRADIERARAEGLPAVVIDVPLLFEGGLDRLCDETWVVQVDRATQKARLRARDRLSEAEAEARLDAQMPLSEKAARATAVIDNGGDLAATRGQVERLWRRALAAGRAEAGGR